MATIFSAILCCAGSLCWSAYLTVLGEEGGRGSGWLPGHYQELGGSQEKAARSYWVGVEQFLYTHTHTLAVSVWWVSQSFCYRESFWMMTQFHAVTPCSCPNVNTNSRFLKAAPCWDAENSWHLNGIKRLGIKRPSVLILTPNPQQLVFW